MPEFTNVSLSSGHLTNFVDTRHTAWVFQSSRTTHDYITFEYDNSSRYLNNVVMNSCTIPFQTISTSIDWDSIRRYISTHQGAIVSVEYNTPDGRLDEQIKLW